MIYSMFRIKIRFYYFPYECELSEQSLELAFLYNATSAQRQPAASFPEELRPALKNSTGQEDGRFHA
jgi:hypothetical protein